MAQMRNTLGCIDCTHIAIRAPKENEHLYVNRKDRHSINMQAIVDQQMHLTNIVIRWPGSTHDAFIWDNSQVYNDFREGQIAPGWLLGDSGYPLQPWLLTPIPRPANPAEVRFNRSLTKTRVCVERAFGLLKSRFRCLDDSGGILCYPIERTCKIIMTCCVLHNVCIERRIPLPGMEEELNEENIADEHFKPQHVNNHHRGGLEARNRLVTTWFAQ
ncbi:putative nuclease HARBI1 [Lytechinus pictus]|uniref:putative nuclease HARBI1 n=1 Tax=Lytechinus pictus TaxID=7653 RepID=UPI0030B9D4B7